MALDNLDSIHYKLIVTGSHLLEKFGNTIESIKKDNLSGEIIQFAAFEEKSSPGLIEFNTVSQNISTICENEKPHYVFITGDRIEAYACTIGAHFSKQILFIMGVATFQRVHGTIYIQVQHFESCKIPFCDKRSCFRKFKTSTILIR